MAWLLSGASTRGAPVALRDGSAPRREREHARSAGGARRREREHAYAVPRDRRGFGGLRRWSFGKSAPILGSAARPPRFRGPSRLVLGKSAPILGRAVLGARSSRSRRWSPPPRKVQESRRWRDSSRVRARAERRRRSATGARARAERRRRSATGARARVCSAARPPRSRGPSRLVLGKSAPILGSAARPPRFRGPSRLVLGKSAPIPGRAVLGARSSRSRRWSPPPRKVRGRRTPGLGARGSRRRWSRAHRGSWRLRPRQLAALWWSGAIRAPHAAGHACFNAPPRESCLLQRTTACPRFGSSARSLLHASCARAVALVSVAVGGSLSPGWCVERGMARWVVPLEGHDLVGGAAAAHHAAHGLSNPVGWEATPVGRQWRPTSQVRAVGASAAVRACRAAGLLGVSDALGLRVSRPRRAPVAPDVSGARSGSERSGASLPRRRSTRSFRCPWSPSLRPRRAPVAPDVSGARSGSERSGASLPRLPRLRSTRWFRSPWSPSLRPT